MTENISKGLLPRFFKLSIINILSSMAVPIAGLIDTAFLGHINDISYLAGVAVASVIFDFIYGACVFLRMGTTGPTAQSEGSGEQREILLILLRSLLIALILGLLLILLQYPLQELGFTLLNVSPEVKIAGKDYFSARILGAPAVLLNFSLIGWLLGREKSTDVLVLFTINCVSNIILDYFFIVHWDWASTGAGAATAVSEYLMFFTGIIFILLEGLFPKLWSIAIQVFDREKMMAMLQLNGDITIRILATRLILVIFIDLSASFGTEILAINSLLFQSLVLVSLMTEGVSHATETLTGNLWGQKLIQQLPGLLRLSSVSGIILGLVGIAPFILFPHFLFSLFTDHNEIIDGMGVYLLWLIPFTFASSLFNVLRGYWLGLTESKVLRNSTIMGSIIGFFPVALAAMHFHNIHILWLALCTFLTISVFVMGYKFPHWFSMVEKLET